MGRKQIVCVYEGRPRELCPIILRRTRGAAKVLTYQFAGSSNSGLPAGGEWPYLWLSKVSDVALRDGRWHSGSKHTQPQGCVEIVDLAINPASSYTPERPIERGERKAPARTRSAARRKR